MKNLDLGPKKPFLQCYKNLQNLKIVDMERKMYEKEMGDSYRDLE